MGTASQVGEGRTQAAYSRKSVRHSREDGALKKSCRGPPAIVQREKELSLDGELQGRLRWRNYYPDFDLLWGFSVSRACQ